MASPGPSCGAQTKSGGRCRNPAGAGTPHSGTGHCRFHLGNTPPHLMAGAIHVAQSLGGPIEIEPHEALLYCVRRAAGDVAFFELKIAALSEEAIVAAPSSAVTVAERSDGREKVSKTQREHPVELNVWIRARDHALERLARFSKMAIDAGIEERRVQVAERMGDLVAALLETVFRELGTKPAERARVLPIVEGRMLELEQVSTVAEDAA